MKFTEEQITKFQEIFERDFGKKMSREDTIESATNLIRYFELVLPIARRIKGKVHQTTLLCRKNTIPS